MNPTFLMLAWLAFPMDVFSGSFFLWVTCAMDKVKTKNNEDPATNGVRAQHLGHPAMSCNVASMHQTLCEENNCPANALPCLMLVYGWLQIIDDIDGYIDGYRAIDGGYRWWLQMVVIDGGYRWLQMVIDGYRCWLQMVIDGYRSVLQM